ncbi:hypothetical protein AVEN_116097-1 [Araneus ventricosus]|uniref:Tc1-like transposase DDE domain-containing protein n=1 Tax=Araneus ventricosus TaxID=182803 RepID=A0A4Y2M4T9_ARAVE|nr:hypothetical protein AVEN_116097-1 [Araneus ventricosus]
MLSRQHGAGSLMVWGAICFNGQISLAFLSGVQKSQNYQDTLSNNFLPFEDIFGGTNWTFQHNKASIHASKSTSQWLRSYMVSVAKWPAQSPDFTPLESVWDILTCSV